MQTQIFSILGVANNLQQVDQNRVNSVPDCDLLEISTSDQSIKKPKNNPKLMSEKPQQRGLLPKIHRYINKPIFHSNVIWNLNLFIIEILTYFIHQSLGNVSVHLHQKNCQKIFNSPIQAKSETKTLKMYNTCSKLMRISAKVLKSRTVLMQGDF